MKIITIDCSSFTSSDDLHHTFAERLSFPSYYGKNLDALHDCLTEISTETRLLLLHWDAAEAVLGRSARRAILDAALKNQNLSLLFD